MVKIFKNKKAQIFTEYAGLIAMIVVIVVAMSLAVRRVFQARIKDTKDTMMSIVGATYRATGGGSGVTPSDIPEEYEPYYIVTESEITRDVNDTIRLKQGGHTGIFNIVFNEITNIQTNTEQLPPRYGN